MERLFIPIMYKSQKKKKKKKRALMTCFVVQGHICKVEIYKSLLWIISFSQIYNVVKSDSF